MSIDIHGTHPKSRMPLGAVFLSASGHKCSGTRTYGIDPQERGLSNESPLNPLDLYKSTEVGLSTGGGKFREILLFPMISEDLI